MISANAAMTGSYDYSEVARSVLIAIAASYAALDLTGRVAAASGRPRAAWFSGGAVAMGIGIWAMHIKAMLAFHLPVPVAYHWPTILAAILVAISASAFALYVASRQKMTWVKASTGSIIMGAGIAGLHYIGMAAMRMPAITMYSPLLVICSLLLAVLFSLIALLMAFDLREETRWTVPRRLGSAVVMGAAVSAMHYTGMAAASFIPASPPDLSHAVSISAVGNNAIAIVSLIVIVAAMVTSSVDRRASVEAERLNQDLERRVAERTSQLTAVNVALAETEERFRKLVEALPDALYVHSENKIVFVNPFGMRLLGVQQPEQLVGKGIFEIVHPDYREVIRQRIQHCYQTGTASSPMECALVALDGSFVEVESAGIPITWKGSPAVEVVARDIRERKRAEEQLRQAQTRTESVLDSMADAHILLDRGWHYLYVNRAAVLAMARPREQILGHTLWELYPDIIGTELERQYRRAMEERIPVVVDFHYPTTNTWWENRFYPAPEGLSVFATDITERKRAEEALQESQAALARAARIATMGELTASIAHEINQPLAAVATNASASLRWLAVQPPNLDEARQAMANAMNEANRASRVIERVRTLLKKALPKLRPLDVNEVIREVLALIHKELTVGGVAVHTELSPDVPTVLGDRVQLQQVMLNLIMNAIDAMLTIKDRPRTLLIKSARDPEGVLVEVQDSGRGLDPKQASRIFDSFFTTKPDGIGLGLSISRSIVEAHGGRLRAEPGSSHGAVFQLILPKAA
jgi:PAS domain S-box-containing protein